MTENVTEIEQKPVGIWKYRLVIAGTALSSLAMAASASAAGFDINGTIGPLIDGFTAVLPSLMALVIALIPVMVVVAFARFFPGLIDNMLNWFKF